MHLNVAFKCAVTIKGKLVVITSLTDQSGHLGLFTVPDHFSLVGFSGMEQGLMNVESLYFVYLWLFVFQPNFCIKKTETSWGFVGYESIILATTELLLDL